MFLNRTNLTKLFNNNSQHQKARISVTSGNVVIFILSNLLLIFKSFN